MISIILRGGLGNNLYMMGCVFAHAKRHGYDYAFPLEIDNPHYPGQKAYVFPGLNYCEKLPNLPLYNEPFFHYAGIPELDDIVLNGYFQSFKYIDDHKEDFIKALGLKIEPVKDWCAIHVRRGDYMRLPDYHPFVGEKYLSDAMDEVYTRTGIDQFKIFSNDIPWCKEFFASFGQYDFIFVEGNNELEDLRQGAECSHQILSNGTFALWQHYLNPNPDKICIGPKRWFGKLLNHDTKDLYPENCIIIPNE